LTLGQRGSLVSPSFGRAQHLDGLSGSIQEGIDLRRVVATHLRRELGVIELVDETAHSFHAAASGFHLFRLPSVHRSLWAPRALSN
jgi:hypothetical protein